MPAFIVLDTKLLLEALCVMELYVLL